MNQRHIIYALTGCSTGYDTPALNTSGVVPVTNVADDVAHVRALLYIDKPVDYYLAPCLTSLYASAALLRTLDVSTALKLPRRPEYTCSGATVVFSENGPAKMLHRPTKLPVAFEWTIHELTLTSDAGHEYTVIKRTGGDGRTYIPWPEEVGIDCAFANAVPTQDIVLTCTPVSYPFDYVATMLTGDRTVIKLLQRTGLLGTFHAAQESHTKLAAVCAAIIRATG